jgi:GT2 family glycosyltransferase
MKPKRLNLAILTYNALAYTKLCLDSIQRNTRNEYNIFVLDNGSTDGSRAWLAQNKGENFYYEEATENLGVPGGRNRLIELIDPLLQKDGFVIFLDNDMELKPGWDEDYISFLADHPEVGIVSAHGHRMVVRQMYRELLPAPAYTAPVDVACGGFACWIRAATIRAVGPYDTKLGKFWHEDDDYSVRALAAGFEVYAMPHAKVVHHEHKSGAANPGIKSDGSPQNQAYLCDKWRKLGVVDAEGRIRRKARPRGAVTLLSRDASNGACALPNQGGFVWLAPQITLRPLFAPGTKAGMVREELLKLKCAKAEFYDVFPFQVEVKIKDAPTFTLDFTESDQEQEVLLAVDVDTEISILSSNGFSPVLAGLGAHHVGAVSLQFHGSPLWRYILGEQNFASTQPLTIISSLLDSDGNAATADAFIQQQLSVRSELRIEALSVNERILATLGYQGEWVRTHWKFFATHFVGGEILVIADPLDHYGQDVYADLRRSHPGTRKLTALVQLSTSTLSESWLRAVAGADEIWVLTEAERQLIIGAGIDSKKVICCALPVSRTKFRRLELSDSPIPGRLCFLARVTNSDDPLLQCCVRAFGAAFTASDPVALMLSIAPNGVHLSAEVLKRVIGDNSVDVGNMAPVVTIDLVGSSTKRNLIYNQVACMIASPHKEIRIELLEAAASGLSILYSNEQGHDWRMLDLNQMMKTVTLDNLLYQDIVAKNRGSSLLHNQTVKQLAISMREIAASGQTKISRAEGANL